MGSVLKLATSPSPPQTISKTEQNAVENEAFMGATLPEAEKKMEGWTQFKPNDKLSLRAEYIPCNLDASAVLQCSMFFEPYTDPQIVTLSDKNWKDKKFSDLIPPKAITLPGTGGDDVWRVRAWSWGTNPRLIWYDVNAINPFLSGWQFERR